MTNLRLYGSLAVSLSVFAAAATGVEVRPGTLEESLRGHDPQQMTELTLTGSINAADLHYIATHMRSLQTLDLSGVSISAYQGAPLATNCDRFPADVLPAYALSGCTASEITLPATITAIGDGALMGSAVKRVTIPASVRSLGMGALAGCPNLTFTELPATVEECGERVLAGCPQLKRVSWGAPSVPDGALAQCPELNTFDCPASLVSIGAEAFAGCQSLASFNFPPSLAQIGSGAFRSSALAEADMSATSLTAAQMGAEVFAQCENLHSCALPPSLSELPRATFMGDAALDPAPALTAKIEHMGALACAGTALAGTVKLGEGLRSLGDWSLAGTDGVSVVLMPSTLQSLGQGAMADMTGLAQMDARGLSAVPATGADAWQGVAQDRVLLHVNPETIDAFRNADQWREFSITTSGLEQLLNQGTGQSGMDARLGHGELAVSTSGKEMARVTLHDLSGRTLASEAAAGTEAVMSVATLPGQVYVVVVTFTDGTRAACKVTE